MIRICALFLFCILAVCGPVGAVTPTIEANGRPFFPLGWYTSSTLDAAGMAQQKAQGMNSVLYCYGSWGSDSGQLGMAQAAAANDMRIMFEVHRYAVAEDPEYPLSLIDHQVDLLKDLPNMIGWYLIDEPELQGVSPSMAQARYAQIKSRDPEHPIYVVHSANDDWRPARAYGYLLAEPPPYTDVIMTDSYLCMASTDEFENPIWKTASVTKYHMDYALYYGKTAYMNVVQTHQGWGLRLPTYAEQRYISYSPIVFGARGLLYWMYNGGYNTPEYKQTVVAPVAREIESLIPAILSDSTSVAISSDHDADTLGHNLPDIGYMFGEDKDGGYVIATNNTADTVAVTLELAGQVLAERLPAQSTQIPVLFEDRTVTLAATGTTAVRRITDTFTPYDVNVYRIYKVGERALIDLGSPDMSFDIGRLDAEDGNTTGLDVSGSNCRRNTDPLGSPADEYMYFAVDDGFAYQGSRQDLYVAVRYFDAGTGSLELQYDSTADPYRSGGSVALTGTNSWKRRTFHVTDAYFGNRQTAGADFRVFGGSGVTFHLDRIEVSTLNTDAPQPDILADTVCGVPPFDVNLDASASQDPNGSTLSYEWDFDNDGVFDDVGPVVSHSYSVGGNYDTKVRVTNNEGISSVASIRVNAYDPLAYFDQFSYVDGYLNGNGGWSGTAAAHMMVDGQAVKISAGMGAYNLAHDVACAEDATGVISVNLNVKRGSGKEAFWRLWVDDPLGRNLACWQGSGFSVQGKVGASGTLTQMQGLTGRWDNLRISIYPQTKQTEFFFNGHSIGVFSHSSTGAGNVVGKLRFQEVSQYGSEPGYVHVDELAVVGEAASGPAPVESFLATPGLGQVTLSWTNPADDDLVGTMIRYKTDGYPASPTDGALVCDRVAAPGSVDSFIHYGLNGITCYYTAFTYNAGPLYTPALASATPYCDPGMRENFDSYLTGALSGQGSWTATVGASAQVQANVAEGGSGKSVLMDPIASGVTVGNQIAYPRSQGYHYVTFDARQNCAGGISSSIVGVMYIYPSNTSTEILRIRIQKDRIVFDPATYTYFPIQPGDWHNVMVGVNVDAKTFDIWFDGSKQIEGYPWKGTGTDIARIVIQSSKLSVFTEQKTYIDNLSMQPRPASIAEVRDEGDYTPSLSRLGFSFDSVSCADAYRYCIGTTSGGSEVRGWTGCGVGEVEASGLSLVEGQQYFITAQAGSGGLWGESATSDGITAAVGAAIPEAKTLGDGEARALRGKTVSAVFSDCFYVQEPDRPSGIKVISSAVVDPGDIISVAGAMRGAGAERYMDAAGNPYTVTSPGPGVPGPIAMSNKNLGGGALHPLAPGALDGLGPNNIGLLVRCWGRVSDIDGTSFKISDGSGVAVTVIARDLASVPDDGEYVVLTGISTVDEVGERLLRIPGQTE